MAVQEQENDWKTDGWLRSATRAPVRSAASRHARRSEANGPSQTALKSRLSTAPNRGARADGGSIAMLVRRWFVTILVVGAVLAAGTMPAASATRSGGPVARELATFTAPGCTGNCGSGSTVGPDGALYVTDPQAGRIRRVDPRTGHVTTFARGFPRLIEAVGGGGAVDIAFLGHTAYVIVTGVVQALGGEPGAVDGLYRVNPDGSISVLADIGAWSTAHPPHTAFDLPTGFLYAMQPFGHGFLVTDGHHNRVLRVRLNGEITEVLAQGNVVPTGLETSWRNHRGARAEKRRAVYVAQAGPVPHLPRTGKVLELNTRTHKATIVASGARLAVDLEMGPHHKLYVLSQGVWDLPNLPENAGFPAAPNTGKLLKVGQHGELISVIEGLDRPTSLEFIKDTAFIITFTGKVLRFDGVAEPKMLDTGAGGLAPGPNIPVGAAAALTILIGAGYAVLRRS